MFGALNFTFNRRKICLAISATAQKNLFLFSYVEKKAVLNCFYMLFNRPRKIFLNFEFLLCLKMVCVWFQGSNGNNIETKQKDASIIGVF